jgi:N-dimethylarginine dimethylaminohydrolase
MLTGCSERTSLGAIQRLSDVLSQGGVRMIVPITVPDTFLHLDCGVLPIGRRRLITAFPLPSSTREVLEGSCGFRVITIPEGWTGANRLGLNILFLNPDIALVPKSAPDSLLRLLHDEGIQSVVLDVSEFEKGGGGIHCLVGVIGRTNEHLS